MAWFVPDSVQALSREMRVLLVVDDLDWAIGRIGLALRDALGAFAGVKVQVVEGRLATISPLAFSKACINADVIHWLCLGAVNKWSSPLLRYKSCGTVHHIGDGYDGIGLAVKAARSAQVLVVTDPVTESRLEVAIPDARIVRLPTGFRARDFVAPRASQRRSLRSEIGVAEGSIVLCWVGNAQRYNKGLPLLGALVDLAKAEHPVHLMLAGRGWDDEMLKPFGESSFVLTEGSSTAELSAFYGAADFLVCTSSVEGGPLPVVEALGCGTRVVSTDVGQVGSWLARIPGSGVLCTPSPTEMCRALGFLSAMPYGDDERQAVSSAAASAFSWEVVSQEWVSLWAEQWRGQSTARFLRILAGVHLFLKALYFSMRVRIVRRVRKLIGPSLRRPVTARI